MRRPEVKAAILAEESVPHDLPGTMENGVSMIDLNFEQTFALADSLDYEPTAEQSLRPRRAAGVDPWSYLYDFLTSGDGTEFVVMYFTNYADSDLDAVYEMHMDDVTVSGLSTPVRMSRSSSMRWRRPTI